MYVLSEQIRPDTYAVVKRFEVFEDAVAMMMERLAVKEGITMRIDNDEMKEFKLMEKRLVK